MVEPQTKSSARLRIGIFFILLWWLPVWLLAPAISDALGYGNDPTASHRVFVGLIIIQTIIGLLGVLIASKEVMRLLKKVPRRKVPRVAWHIIITGKSDIIASPKVKNPT